MDNCWYKLLKCQKIVYKDIIFGDEKYNLKNYYFDGEEEGKIFI